VLVLVLRSELLGQFLFLVVRVAAPLLLVVLLD
jgi:hypothetical protein